MNYGPHSELVNEVIEFAISGSVLAGGSDPQNTTIIRELSDATRYAWDETYGPEELTWSDIRSQQMSGVWELIYQESDFGSIDSQISSELDSLSKTVATNLEPKYKDLLDEIIADLRGCIYSRAIQGNGHSFYEQLFDIYRCGSWPCGWDGQYPQGQPLVFAPAIV